MMLRRSWQAGLQLEVVKRIVPVSRKEELDCRSYKKVSWKAAQGRSGPDKWPIREGVAERRGASAKRLLSKEVAQQRKVVHPSIHPSTYPSSHSFVHSFI